MSNNKLSHKALVEHRDLVVHQINELVNEFNRTHFDTAFLTLKYQDTPEGDKPVQLVGHLLISKEAYE